jgi:hypothetical protein
VGGVIRERKKKERCEEGSWMRGAKRRPVLVLSFILHLYGTKRFSLLGTYLLAFEFDLCLLIEGWSLLLIRAPLLACKTQKGVFPFTAEISD